ncbi:MAG: hypothetical protein PHR16_12550 [Methylovulum sp.]|nr:hypothetical protein [Methylovulum sp.]
MKILTCLMLMLLAACSSQNVKQQEVLTTKPAIANKPPSVASQNPPMMMAQNGKTLNLVRIMDGAACKNELEGAKGIFLVYADPNDIERIKQEKGAKVFTEFEAKIQIFSEHALQHAVNTMNLAKDPFALGDDVTQQKLAQQLTDNFRVAVIDSLDTFKKETALTIDVAAFPPSFVFYQTGCQATLPESDSSEDDNYLEAN